MPNFLAVVLLATQSSASMPASEPASQPIDLTCASSDAPCLRRLVLSFDDAFQYTVKRLEQTTELLEDERTNSKLLALWSKEAVDSLKRDAAAIHTMSPLLGVPWWASPFLWAAIGGVVVAAGFIGALEVAHVLHF